MRFWRAGAVSAGYDIYFFLGGGGLGGSMHDEGGKEDEGRRQITNKKRII